MIRAAIIEDDFRIAAIHQQFLESMDGVTVVGQALRASEAWELLENESVDLLLVDIYMPDQLGTDLVRELKMKYPKMDFIMITAASERDLIAKSMDAGAFHYLVKPLELAKLNEVILSYQDRVKRLSEGNLNDQSEIDALFGRGKISSEQVTELPKGIHPLTLEKVNELVGTLVDGTSAEEIGERLGASRTTARRYLEYLVAQGKMRAELEYGIVGRPERKYFAN
ncbi:Transcriptional regulatory protein CitT [Lysinibacillus sphaericus]|nr:Transcriptional regulatory protein CitT [Lysinibacillus sphaericus]